MYSVIADTRAPQEAPLSETLASIKVLHPQEHLRYLAADERMGRRTG